MREGQRLQESLLNTGEKLLKRFREGTRRLAQSHYTTDVFPNKVCKSNFSKLTFIFKAVGTNGNLSVNLSVNWMRIL